MMDLETISAPGVYDISADSYHADPCPEPSLSGSVIKVIANKSPRHAWACHPRLNAECESTEKASFDMGDAFHKLVLGKGNEIALLDFKDFKTDAARKSRDAARADGFIPLLTAQFDRAQTMAQAAKAQVPQWEELALAMSHGIPERTYIWQEETPFGPVWCRCMVDWTASHGNLHPDWKSTEVGAGPDEWGAKVLWNLDYHIQAAWNARALRKAGVQHPELFFAVVETKFPHALACMKPAKVALAMAERDIERAIVTWAWCLKNNRWPGYRNVMAWVDPPAWKERGFLEREERNELSAESTIAMLEEAAAGRERLALPESPRDDLDAFGLEPIK